MYQFRLTNTNFDPDVWYEEDLTALNNPLVPFAIIMKKQRIDVKDKNSVDYICLTTKPKQN